MYSYEQSSEPNDPVQREPEEMGKDGDDGTTVQKLTAEAR